MEPQKLPNATLILVFGITSIVTCCCYGIVGLIFGVAALVLADRALKRYAESPQEYEEVQTVRAGRILAIIGLILNAIYLGAVLWLISTLGLDFFQDPEKMQEFLDQYYPYYE